MLHATVLSDAEENAIARKNARLYSACAAFSGAASPVSIALGGLAGSYLLGTDKSLATAPVTAFTAGTAIGAIVAAAIMQRIGRKHGFMTGAVIGIAGMVVAASGLIAHSFLLYTFGLLVNGLAGGFYQQYRFAATDRGTAEFRAKAISWVLVGGIVAAVIGPQVVIWTTDLLAPVPFAGAYLSATVLFMLSMVMLSLLEPSAPPRMRPQDRHDSGRPLGEIVSQPRFMVSVLCATGAFALMSFVMTAAPLAMIGCGFSQTESTLGIQWHVLAMFGPSLFTGNLIARFGKIPIVATGMLLLLVSATIALAGRSLANFWISLMLLGVGWNFAFIGATAMVTDTYRTEERGKAQGANDFILFGTVALASFLSGQMLNAFGWETINFVIFPVVATCLTALFWLSRIDEPQENAA